MKKNSIKFRILIPLVFAFLILICGFIIVTYSSRQKIIESDLQKKISHVLFIFKSELNNDADMMMAVIKTLSIDKELKIAIRNGSREKLLNTSKTLFEQLRKEHNVTHFYFTDPHRVNLLRVHKPDRYGDKINRHTMLMAESTGKVSYGIELGPLGTFTLRVVQPLYNEDGLIGYLELGKEIDHIITKVSHICNVDLYFSISKEFLDHKNWETDIRVINHSTDWDRYPLNVIIAQTTREVPTAISDYFSEEHHSRSSELDLKFMDGRHKKSIFTPLIDASGTEVGDIVIVKDVTREYAEVKENVIVCSLLSTVTGAVLFLLFYLHIDHVELKLIMANDRILENANVRKREQEEKHKLERHLLHAQKMESIGVLAAGIAHEINTPTQFISDNTFFIHDSFSKISILLRKHSHLLEMNKAGSVTPEFVNEVDDIIRDIEVGYLLEEIPVALNETKDGLKRITEIVQSMKTFSHPDGKEKTSVDLNKMIKSTITVSRNEWKYTADVETDLNPDIPLVQCYPSELNQVVLNLIINATHAIGETSGEGSESKGKISISTRKNRDWVEIHISDTGMGIPEDIGDKVFEPFFTTKEVGKGTGQGLSIAHSVVVKRHNGKISFDTVRGKGTTFTIRLPIVSSPSEKAFNT